MLTLPPVHNERSAPINDTWAYTIHGPKGGSLALRAVVFDFGMVLTGPPDPDAHNALLRITGLDPERHERLYWADRHAYDEGKFTGLEYWQKFAREAGLNFKPSELEDLNAWDARMWATENLPMVRWQLALKQCGLLTAVVSNIGDVVCEHAQRSHGWLSRFDVLVWSYQLRMAKPDPAIYRYALEKLDTQPEETLFIDDRPVNVEAANALGIKGMLFTTVEKLREDLIVSHLDSELPLPA